MNCKNYRKIQEIIKSDTYALSVVIPNNDITEYLSVRYNFQNKELPYHYANIIKRISAEDLFFPISELSISETGLSLVTQVAGVSLANLMNSREAISEQILLKWLHEIAQMQLNLIRNKICHRYNYLRYTNVYVDQQHRMHIVFPDLQQQTCHRNYIIQFFDKITERQVQSKHRTFKKLSGGFTQVLNDLQKFDIYSETDMESFVNKTKSLRGSRNEASSIEKKMLKQASSVDKLENPFSRKTFFLKSRFVLKQNKNLDSTKVVMRKINSMSRIPNDKRQSFTDQSKVVFDKIDSMTKITEAKRSNIAKVNKLLYLRMKNNDKQIRSEKQIKIDTQASYVNNQTERKDMQILRQTNKEDKRSIEKYISPDRKSAKKLIIRDPFQKREMLFKIGELEESIIEKKTSEYSEDSNELNNIVNILDTQNPLL